MHGVHFDPFGAPGTPERLSHGRLEVSTVIWWTKWQVSYGPADLTGIPVLQYLHLPLPSHLTTRGWFEDPPTKCIPWTYISVSNRMCCMSVNHQCRPHAVSIHATTTIFNRAGGRESYNVREQVLHNYVRGHSAYSYSIFSIIVFESTNESRARHCTWQLFQLDLLTKAFLLKRLRNLVPVFDGFEISLKSWDEFDFQIVTFLRYEKYVAYLTYVTIIDFFQKIEPLYASVRITLILKNSLETICSTTDHVSHASFTKGYSAGRNTLKWQVQKKHSI